MGASDLLTLEDYLEPQVSQKIRLRGSPCLELCGKNQGEPPFVKINDEVFPRVSLSSLIEKVKTAVSKEDSHVGNGK